MAKARILRILVVDDNPDTAEATAQLLGLYGHDARAAYSCSDARNTLTGIGAFTPDVIMLDLRLPDGNGMTLASELRELLKPRPLFIAHTGVAFMEQKCLDAGFDHYLLKPVDPGILNSLLIQYVKP